MASPANSYHSYHHPLDGLPNAPNNPNNGFPVIDFELDNLSNQIEISILKDRLTTLQTLQEKMQTDMEDLNGELDDLRAGNLHLLSVNDELKCSVNVIDAKNKHMMAEFLPFKNAVVSSLKLGSLVIIFGVALGGGFRWLGGWI